MNLLFRIVHAAHATGTHHKLALDALQRLTIADAEAWQRVFLLHATLYMEGAKAPDTEFKDFKNHVLHVRDGYWGGAPEKVANWYGHLVEALREGDWARAVWSAGVLSHYYTDPIHPFHSAQSEAENAIHRAVEWSISRDYDALKQIGERRRPAFPPEAPSGDDWLQVHVIAGAERGNAHYERLIAHYDFNIGVVDPPAGLDDVARALVGELLCYAADGFARVLERAIKQSGARPPTVNLTLATILAAVTIPLGRLRRRLADAEDRRIVEAMYDELVATGRVEHSLPEDDRLVRDLYAREVAAPRAAQRARQLRQRLPGARGSTAKPRSAIVTPPTGTAAIQSHTSAPSIANLADRFSAALAGATTAKESPPGSLIEHMHRASPLRQREKAAAVTASGERRGGVQPGDDVERAPSIGPRTAARLAAVGVTTIGDLLAADVAELAARLRVARIDAATLRDWQDQARLVTQIPVVGGSHAQLLVLAGYRDAAAIAAAEPPRLCAALLKAARTTAGQRVLREGDALDVERVKTWVDAAARASAA